MTMIVTIYILKSQNVNEASLLCYLIFIDSVQLLKCIQSEGK